MPNMKLYEEPAFSVESHIGRVKLCHRMQAEAFDQLDIG